MKRTLLVLLLPLAAHAQLALFSFDGTTETPVGATYNYGPVANGNTKAVRFRIFNNATSGTVVYLPSASGAGFSITAVNGTLPYTIPPVSSPLNFLEFTVSFSAGAPATYSASLQITGPAITTISILLLATSTPGPVLTGIPPGCSPDGSGGISFAAVTIGGQGLCNFSLSNPNSVPVVISSIAVTGASFSILGANPAPVTLAPGAATTFTLQLKPQCGTAIYSGSLSINTASYALSGNGITPSLPAPALTFDAQTFSSMEQHTLSISLPSPSVCGASGNVNLTFTPAANLPDDFTIVFVSRSSRSLPFTVSPGSSQVLLDGNASVTFATGSTTGSIAFTLSGPSISGAPPSSSFPIAPAAIYLDSATASNQILGQLNITVIGYDNTYSAGKMSFTFFDASGNTIGSAIAADFTANFQTFFSGQQQGSTFLMRVSFPIQGNQTLVAKVQATLVNSAGQTQTGSLTFQ